VILARLVQVRSGGKTFGPARAGRELIATVAIAALKALAANPMSST
jgi:hypothetical protein